MTLDLVGHACQFRCETMSKPWRFEWLPSPRFPFEPEMSAQKHKFSKLIPKMISLQVTQRSMMVGWRRGGKSITFLALASWQSPPLSMAQFSHCTVALPLHMMACSSGVVENAHVSEPRAGYRHDTLRLGRP